MIRRVLNVLPAWMRKLMPTIVLLVIATVAGATNVFSANVRDFVQHTLMERVKDLQPLALNLLFAVIIVNFAWALAEPTKTLAEKSFDKSGASPRGKQLGMKVVVLLYWGVVVGIMLAMFAGELMGKMVLGFSVFGAALTLAMQGAANDFICGVLMQFSCRVREGDNIKTIGLDVEGKVLDVGYLSTTVDSSDGVMTVPNRKIWESAIKVKKAPPSKLILPEGVKWPPRENEAGTRVCRK
jgi:small-conductance mechanosensitive channel